MLRQAREAEGLHIAALAVALKVPVKKLEALEADRFDQLPDMVFVRALASSVCRNLKIDPAAVLERLPHTIAPTLRTDEAGINTPFRTPGETSMLSVQYQLSRPLVLAVVALLVGALVLVFFPARERAELVVAPKIGATDSGPAFPPSSATNEPAVVERAVSPPMTVTPAPLESSPVLVAPASAVALAAPRSLASAPVVKASALAMAASSPVVSASTALVTNGLLVFRARDVSWVEVHDAKGTVQVRKNLAQGETLAASGALPLTVVVGRADVIDVQIRGQAFDLMNVAIANVAHFEVK
jgi:cytoskeleton protein RodZ